MELLWKGYTISAYLDLSDEDKIDEAIRCVARGVDIPTPIALFLQEQGIYELIVSNQETSCQELPQATCAS